MTTALLLVAAKKNERSFCGTLSSAATHPITFEAATIIIVVAVRLVVRRMMPGISFQVIS